MTTRADRDNLLRLTSQFDLLHEKLLRIARALRSTEDQRDVLLRSLASRSHPAGLATWDRYAGQARANRDRLQSVLSDLEALVAAPEGPASATPHKPDDDTPESHARLLFAVLLFRDGMLSVDEFDREVTAAFGARIGSEIAAIIADATARSALRESGAW